ncbi:phage shock protein A (PspA) family protein [Arthrobacter sp. P2b]|nr:phage shock protein A (PspA) family protein [Arthrobacter sp. P2b]
MKQSIFTRVPQLAKANLNALVDSAEDPQKMLDQMVREYSNNIREAEAPVGQTIGNLQMAEDDHARAVNDANTWGNKAIAPPGRPTSSAPPGKVSTPTSSMPSPRSPSASR